MKIIIWLVVIVGEKPSYEVGSAAKLSFTKKVNKTAAAAVWKLSDDDDFINEDELLDEKDKLKPSATNLKGFSKIYSFLFE